MTFQYIIQSWHCNLLSHTATTTERQKKQFLYSPQCGVHKQSLNTSSYVRDQCGWPHLKAASGGCTHILHTQPLSNLSQCQTSCRVHLKHTLHFRCRNVKYRCTKQCQWQSHLTRSDHFSDDEIHHILPSQRKSTLLQYLVGPILE